MGTVKSATPEKISIECFKEKSNDENYVTDFILMNNKILITTFIDGVISHTNEWNIDYLLNYIVFYNTPEEKTKLLQEIIDYKNTVRIPVLENKLQFEKEKMNHLISLRDNLTI